MYRTSLLTLALVGGNAVSFAEALEARENSGTAPAIADIATSFSFTAHTRHTITTTSRSEAQSSSPHASNEQHLNKGDHRCEGESCVIERCRPRPVNGAEHIDWSLPCWAMKAITFQCEYGPGGLELSHEFYEFRRTPGEGFPRDWKTQPSELVRACFCSSQYADMLIGCGTCFEKHGGDASLMRDMLVSSNETLVHDTMREYCDVDATPDLYGLSNAWIDALDPRDTSSSGAQLTPSASASKTSSFHDPIGNATDVSLYFTPFMTGSAAVTVDMPTASMGDDETRPNAWYTYSSLPTSGGQVVPTAQAVNYGSSEDGGDDDSESTGGTTTTAAGAMETAMVNTVGALGFAMLVIAL